MKITGQQTIWETLYSIIKAEIRARDNKEWVGGKELQIKIAAVRTGYRIRVALRSQMIKNFKTVIADH